MPILKIENLGNLEVPVINTNLPLLQHIQSLNIDWMHACGGKGRCTTCKIRILSGIENFNDRTQHEQRFFESLQLKESERLTCQATISGNVVCVVPDECKLPHAQYTH